MLETITFFLPEICIALTAIIILISGLFIKNRNVLTAISCIGIIASAVLTVIYQYDPMSHGIVYASGLLCIDMTSFYFRMLFAVIALLVVMASQDYAKNFESKYPEYLVLINLALLGMTLLVSSYNLISMFASLELMALSFYALTSLMNTKQSAEAGMKYILLGGINSAILLFGMSLVFGYTGSINIDDIFFSIMGTADPEIGLILGIAMIIAGFSFKTAAVPFHSWAPDVYDGSPTTITLFLSTASKLAGMATLARLIEIVSYGSPTVLAPKLAIVIAVLSVLSMLVGNIGAIRQTNIKKMLAFSGISQTGYMMIALAAFCLNAADASVSNYEIFIGLITFAVAFALAEAAAFTGVITISDHIKSDKIENYRGIAKQAPFAAVVITIALLSLMGLPATAGFIGKFEVFASTHNTVLIIIGVLNSVISAAYYLNVIRVMWTGENEYKGKIEASWLPLTVMVVAATLVIGIGLFGFNYI